MKSKVFPIVIKKGSAIVKIYRVAHEGAKEGIVYCVSWYIGSLRKLKQFTDLTKAKMFASERATLLASGEAVGIDATRTEIEELRAARGAAHPTPLLAAVEEWRRAKEICDGNLISAAEEWKRKRGLNATDAKVSEVVDKFRKAKASQGVDVKATYERYLPAFLEAFGSLQISLIGSHALDDWLGRRYSSHPISRNTARKRVISVFRWARRAGLLPRDVTTEAELTESAYVEPPDIGIIDPLTLTSCMRIVRKKARVHLPALALACWAGLRRREVHSQAWEDIDLDRSLLRVTRAKKGTPARRLVPLCEAAVSVLREFQGEGPVCIALSIDRIRKVVAAEDIYLPRNCFRHSFISHRVAQTGNIPETSIEAGNSVRIIHRHYRALVSKEQGKAWFKPL